MLKLINFEKILNLATNRFNLLDNETQKSLKEELSNGKALLNDKKQLDAYLYYYGDIHREKLQIAYKQIPEIINGKEISVIDWGCGQGLASIILNDFFDNNSRKIKIVDLTLIEPSKFCLQQADSYVGWSIPTALRTLICKPEEEVDSDDILVQRNIVVHLLSNIVDLPNFIGDGVREFLAMNNNSFNIIICVSPYYAEEGRGKRMENFGKSLKGFNQIYKLEKHTDEWDNDFSCQIHIYSNS